MTNLYKKPRIFICHASEDKKNVARPLSELLSGHGIDVWYDEYSLEVGDSLRRSIESGISSCDYGVVILSPSFFSREWPQRELDALHAREVAEKSRIILPVWHNVDAHSIIRFSPILADRIALSTDHGLEKTAEQIALIALSSHGKPGLRWWFSTQIVSNLNRKDVDKRVVETLEEWNFQCEHGLGVHVVSLQDDYWEKRVFYMIYACCRDTAKSALYAIDLDVQPEVFDASQRQ